MIIGAFPKKQQPIYSQIIFHNNKNTNISDTNNRIMEMEKQNLTEQHIFKGCISYYYTTMMMNNINDKIPIDKFITLAINHNVDGKNIFYNYCRYVSSKSCNY